MREGMGSRPVVDGWYSLLPGVCSAQRAVRELPVFGRLPGPLRAALMRVAVIRGLLLFAASVRAPLIGVTREDPGSGTTLALRALFGRRRKLIVFQFIVHPRRHPLRRVLLAWDRWAVRRALVRGHALTRDDQATLAERYGLAPERFPFVPWPLARTVPEQLPPEPAEPLVLSAGRAYCDWLTLFHAARGRDWPLTVVCANEDRAAVEELNTAAGGVAQVLTELPPDEFDALLRRATVSAAVMVEAGTSQGHIRVMDAAAAGVPIVASATSSLRGYVTPGETGMLVPVGDATALGDAVDALLADAELRARLRTAAWERASAWQVPQYMETLAAIVRGEPPRLPDEAPDPERPAAVEAVAG